MSASDPLLDVGAIPRRVGVVLLRPKSPGNVGSVARAMKNMGFERLVIADPIRFDDPAHFEREARRLAWNAADLLDQRQTVASLDAALSPFHFVVGTTSNPLHAARVLTPRAVAREVVSRLVASSSSSVALLFGQEDIGLTRDHLARCNILGSVPSSTAYPSLNLSHAVLLFLYELRVGLLEQPADGASTVSEALPRREQVEGFFSRFENALEEIGFLRGTAKGHMMRELRAILNRSVLTDRELAIFEGLIHRVLWNTRRGA
ncbi:MAG: RNA methyltransferase [Acidobacteriota bacterium]